MRKKIWASPAPETAATFGKIGVAFGAGFILGPALGGLFGEMSPRLPFWIAAGLSLATLAAWTMLARVLLNLDEFITRE